MRLIPVCLLAAGACIAQADRWPGCCPSHEGCPREYIGVPHDTVPWMESIAMWERMFPAMRGLGPFLACVGLDQDQIDSIGTLVEECDGELDAMEDEIFAPGSQREFFEAFVSEDFEALDLELAEGRTDEFEDAALAVVAATVADIRLVLTREQIERGEDLVFGLGSFTQPLDRHGPRMHRSRSTHRTR